MKLTLKLMLVVCLFSSIALAEDGNMGNGGRTCTTPQPCRPAAHQPEKTVQDTEETDSILDIVRNYLVSIFG